MSFYGMSSPFSRFSLRMATLLPAFYLSLLAGAALSVSLRAAEETLSFNRDIRPILAGNCYDCHGPDEEGRKAELRLDLRAEAETVLGVSGELLARITSDDPDDVMPPPDSHRSLEPGQIEILRQWLAQGSPYERHWAFDPPEKAPIPETGNSDWAKNEIDHFILARLEERSLAPSQEADPHTLIRRVYLDLIGLPPTLAEADSFVADTEPGAYERMVDRLLDSPRYGEKWARQWLDLARYADTNGYEKDRPRTIWPYRDWVIGAINADLPYDQFSIEQLAGDMIPNSTHDQVVATGFHRNTMINEEGGIDPLEYRYYAMVDRVATTGTVWMGLSIGCAQCHTHKYDPITHHDYFAMMGLLNNADEVDLDVPSDDLLGRRAEIEKQVAALEASEMARIDEAAYRQWAEEMKQKQVQWERVTPSRAEAGMPRIHIEKDGVLFAAGDFNKREVYTISLPVEAGPDSQVTAIRLEVLPDPRLPAHGPGIGFYEGRRGDFFLSEFGAKTAEGMPVTLVNPSHSYGKISVGSGSADAVNVIDGEGSTGWSTSRREGEVHHLVLNFETPLAAPTTLEVELLFERHFAAALGKFAFSFSRSPKSAVALPSGAPDPLNATDEEMKRWYLRSASVFVETRKKLQGLEAGIPAVPATLVMRERPEGDFRVTRRRHRGEYLKAEEEVAPAVPAIFPPLPEGAPANRLTFARWLMSDRNPLVARVAVNRAWQAIFGRGIMESPDDFGTQSAPPTHPELLDWLAVEFREQGWSRKRLHRLIVTSATYRQDSALSPEVLASDPENLWLARGPRIRLQGEVVRDQALMAGGVLSEKMGGPGVYPPQPDSVTRMAYGKVTWKPSAGEDRFRRSLYTFAKRTAPFAAFTTFDGPTGESCVAKRDRSNTPLQALTLLNDAMFLEIAAALAREEVEKPATTPGQRATRLFRRFLIRQPTEEERNALVSYFEGQRLRFENGELDANALVPGNQPVDASLAAWTLVVRVIMNLDETLTKG